MAAPPPPERYEAALLLAAAGDALGFRGGLWEYCTAGAQIHAELRALGGLNRIELRPPEWRLSDDTVLHLATAEGLCSGLEGDALLQELARHYVAAMEDMEGRKPGPSSILGTSQLRPGEPHGYPRPEELPTLIQVSIESGRMTHHHPTGYLGALAVALFGALAVRGEPPEVWGAELLRVLPHAWEYVEGVGVAVGDNAAAWDFFGDSWRRYAESRGLLEGCGPPRVPALPTPEERDAEYARWALQGWAGRSGHDAPMVALEALLAAGDSWEELCARAVLHGGDSDSTGTIAAGCWGLRWGLSAVPPSMHRALEYRPRLCRAARRLHELAWGR
ncbi:ADP-ribosylhydrolase ARH1-like isoform X2 [Cyrtonyx montezumae]|uniref:ADP-ribosylhydrolase ARH1-like isoform X2 n=1 Tax=Cyrtonyx montezumae TaxID=9017 RepID=UPI0032DBE6C9